MSLPLPFPLLFALLLGCGGTVATTEPPTEEAIEDPGDTGEAPSGEAEPAPDAPWNRDEVEAPGSITFTELAYHPAAGDSEWLELHNPMALDMDLSGWSLSGGVSFAFAEGTVLAAGGYLVVAADPDALDTDALGPWQGELDNGGERLELVSYSGRRIDTVRYGDDTPWPVHPDGSGVTLAKIAPTSASDRAEHWAGSRALGGTPGEANGLDPLEPPTVAVLVAEDATWTYDASGAPEDGWQDPGFDDAGWESGQAPFFAGAVDELVEATAWATADNYFALYVGEADGGALQLVGEDTDGSWTTVEEIALEVGPADHLYVAAWELTGDSSSPQMVIAELELPDELVGTDASSWEWVLGPSGANPQALPGNAPPSEEEVASVVDAANADGSWEPPAVEASRGTSPWGSSVGDAFTDAALYVWADTFDASSVTNSQDTYALFRSVDPVAGPSGNAELEDLPTQLVLRTPFSFEGSPSAATLTLDCTVDDGAAIYLNGEEVLRVNLPVGDLEPDTLAEEAVDELLVYETIPTDALLHGDNVLAVALHQAEAEDTDLAFACELTAVTRNEVAETVLLAEVAAGGAWVELVDVSGASQVLDGLVLASSAGHELALEGELEPGERAVVEGWTLDAGERLFLSDGEVLLDAVRVDDRARARLHEAGDWGFPAEETPGDENVFALHDEVVIHEIQYHQAPVSREGEAYAERDEEWIELFNRGDEEVDLSGWQLVDAVAFELPEGTVLEAGGHLVVARDPAALEVEAVGGWEGSLGNGGDRIVLIDAAGNVADEVRYSDGGRWPAAADGGGSTLELRDPWADNAVPEAWAASDESGHTAWGWTTLRGVATPSAVGPDGQWEELVLGLLDAGEVLIDDLSLVRDPDGSRVELVQDGTFDDAAASWRLLGTHRHSEVVEDPDDPGNPVLRLVATGPTGHMHNHAETTLLEDLGAHDYELSFRARWVSGSNQLHSRLYFNRLANTTLVAQPEMSGTPGEANSVAEDNVGPTFQDFQQDVVVPTPGQPVVVSVSVDDPDGVEAVTVWASVDGGAFEGTAMAEERPGSWWAELDGEEEGALVQLYVEAEDGTGETATFPAGGVHSRALYRVASGTDATEGLRTFRLLMTEEDAAWLHEDVHLMSNDRVGATVVYDEREIFYDVGVRLKGSQRGRPTSARVGYGVRFDDAQPFRGSHTSVMLDRSEGVGYGQREVLLNLVMTRAGSVSGEHNDLVHLEAPVATYDGPAELQLDRFTDLVLASQFADGDDGTRFEYELIYYPYTTDDGTAEGLKLPQPDSVVGTSVTDLGDDAEAWRWTWLIKNNTRRDDYSAVQALGRTFDLSGEDFFAEVGEVIDVEQWLEAFAYMTLSGATDQYGAGSQHNAQVYVRPEDGRVLLFPHDLDYFSSSSMALVGQSDLAQLLEDPANERSYYGYLHAILERAYSTDHLGPWCDQLGELLPGQDFASHCAFVDDRAAWVWSGSSESIDAVMPWVDFQITTNGGEDFSAAGAAVLLEGTAWVDVRAIRLEGEADDLELSWLDGQTWQATAPLALGANSLVLEAIDRQGEVVATDAVVVTRE